MLLCVKFYLINDAQVIEYVLLSIITKVQLEARNHWEQYTITLTIVGQVNEKNRKSDGIFTYKF